jgi:hypothetical protein
MMRPVLLRSFAVLAVIALVIGCSSDSGTDVTIKQGNPNDPTYLAVRDVVVPVIDSLIERNFDHLCNPYGFPIDVKTDWRDLLPGLPDDTVEYSYDDETGWFAIYVGNFATTINSVIVDSVRFKIDELPSSSFSNRVDEIEANLRVVKSYDGQETDYSEEQYYCRSGYEDVNTSTVSVLLNGMIEIDKYESAGGVLTHDNFEIEVDVSDLAFTRDVNRGSWDSGVLDEGMLDIHIDYTVDVTEGTSTTSDNSAWSIQVSIDQDGVATIDATSGNTVWSFTENF